MTCASPRWIDNSIRTFTDSDRTLEKRFIKAKESITKRFSDLDDAFTKRLTETDLNLEQRITDSEVCHTTLISESEQHQEAHIYAIAKSTGSLETWRQESDGTVEDEQDH